jgi:hypothetical protein
VKGACSSPSIVVVVVVVEHPSLIFFFFSLFNSVAGLHRIQQFTASQ